MKELFPVTTPKDVRTALVNVLQEITGLPAGRVLIETMMDRRPENGVYCTLWMKSSEPLVQGEGEYIFTDDDTQQVLQVLKNETHCTIQISFWGAGAYDMAVLAVSDLQNANRFLDLWRIIGFAGIDGVQDTSTYSGAQIQQQAHFNLSFYAAYERTYSVDWFNQGNTLVRHTPNG